MHKWNVLCLLFICSTIWTPFNLLSGEDRSVKNNNGKVLHHVKIKELQTFGGDQIYSAFGIASLSDGSLIVSDKLDNKIKRFDAAGKIVKEIGKRGRKPGEFSGPGPVAVGSNFIAVADFQSPRIQLFSFDLIYITEFFVPGPIINMAYDKNDDLWVGLLVYEETTSLVKVHGNGHIMGGIQLKNITKDGFNNLFNFTISRDGSIFVIYACQNVVEIWNIEGQFLSQKQIPGFPGRTTRISLQRSTKGYYDGGADRMIPNGVLFFKIGSDTMDNIYILGEDYSICPQKDVLILNKQGELTAMLELPRESNWIYIDPRQNIWSIEDQRLHICKYKILY